MSFWDDLYSREQPVIGMSPMDGVTDAPFRYMVAKYGRASKPSEPGKSSNASYEGGVDVIFTEFVSVDGLHFAEGAKKARMLKELVKARDLVDIDFPCEQFCSPHSYLAASHQRRRSGLKIISREKSKYPFEVAQVFGNKPEFFVEAAKLVESLGFDGIDINMGCPAKNVSENGCGAGLIRTPKLAQEIILATKAATKLPVSVKTRIGVSSALEMDEWIEALCEVRPANISLHGRTLKQLYQGSADWEAIGRAASIVHKNGLHILGNGDVTSLSEAKEKVAKYGVDGVLIGRAAEGNPGIFLSESKSSEPSEAVDMKQRLAWAVEHAQVYEQVFKPQNPSPDDVRWFLPMRKHLAWYAHGFPGAADLRTRLMKTTSAREVERVIEELFTSEK